MPTFTGEQWGRKESADWWSTGQVLRQQIYGTATEMMLTWPVSNRAAECLTLPQV